MLSTQWYCFDCCCTRLGGCTRWGGRISHNLKSRSRRQWGGVWRWRVDRWREGQDPFHPAAQDVKFGGRHCKGSEGGEAVSGGCWTKNTGSCYWRIHVNKPLKQNTMRARKNNKFCKILVYFNVWSQISHTLIEKMFKIFWRPILKYEVMFQSFKIRICCFLCSMKMQ